ncbi:Crp/Fnr family transcriptional regulator [Ulvibacterium marinum]|uniref:Crp/Fnr family transcriptional regulator n=1 Tax=Ulvibacterium marinum TaxID=2419782 RepID=A0A3B0C5K6_9FLAO|nr:Crp/Fnr family transcriptional regulator [Ulvibacterium marinum]RKN81695.1 Crp/Fnr family transcriptional regulator [Ulvibacterium marinum]
MEVGRLNTSIDTYNKELTLKSRNAFAALCVEKTFLKGDLLLNLNQSDRWEYVLVQGIARTFLLNTEGEEITLSFFEDNTILPPYVTRTKNGRSLLYCEAITNCTFARLDAKAFEALMVENLEIRDFGNTVLRQELLQKVDKEIQMASWTAKARLEQFRKDFSMLENNVPHPMIASYLGITNVSLSRLRKQL